MVRFIYQFTSNRCLFIIRLEVFVGEKKYACETCIKGHRSSTCKHTDRPLFEIKKKGRPVTQFKEYGDSTMKKGSVKVPACAAFPSGLPEELEASVALQPSTDHSDSEHSGHASPISCSCKDTGSCDCWTVRPPRPKRKAPTHRERRGSAGSSSTPETGPQLTQPAGLVVDAHSGDYRPVLPRPSLSQQQSPTLEYPSDASSSKGPASRHQSHHGQMFFSPYGRAYEYAHGPEFTASHVSSTFQADESPLSFTSSPDVNTTVPPMSSWISTLTAQAQVAPISPGSLLLENAVEAVAHVRRDFAHAQRIVAAAVKVVRALSVGTTRRIELLHSRRQANARLVVATTMVKDKPLRKSSFP
ncbi:uncharacterized protein FIBRA_07597 [Fibroporia radiculosa]|uniref:Copper-fist domain-containing protein n=1 Tax=Fibroporia radiculosa TaxID=599839 RepID=J4IBW7_9APHY|nr:uncharacterized protein FIBRA_07597 [Fibroporia radiculosa]CCM05381.1 predicted protein [Fibroporia radiculosa]